MHVGCGAGAPDNSPADYNQAGMELLASQEYEAAIASFDGAIDIEADDYNAWFNRGIALDRLGHYNAAAASYARAIEIQPENERAWFHRGESLMVLRITKMPSPITPAPPNSNRITPKPGDAAVLPSIISGNIGSDRQLRSGHRTAIGRLCHLVQPRPLLRQSRSIRAGA